ncbi:MAG: substrate import-associated zinc metallohydrolase lipoprotein [Mangrovibacterium sp.]
MRNLILLITTSILFALSSCGDNDNISSSGEDLFPKMEIGDLDEQLIELFKDYNTRVEYRYIKNLLPSDWYYITPPKEELVLPMSKLIVDLWISPLIDASSKEFVTLTFPKMLVYVGSPALQLDKTEVLGEAEGGTLVRFTKINEFDDSSVDWISSTMHTAYHEYAHIIHQRYGFPDTYLKVSPDSYTKNGWTVVTQRGALQKGVVTPYASSSPQEDFVELFAECIIATDEKLEYYFTDVSPWGGMSQSDSEELNKDNEGRRLLRTKREILKKYMSDIELDMDKLRTIFQSKLTDKSNTASK